METSKRISCTLLSCITGTFCYLLVLPILLIFYVISIVATVVVSLRYRASTNTKLLGKLSAEDALWVQETPEARSVITAVMKLHGNADVQHIRQQVTTKLVDQQRVNCRIITEMGYCYWIQDKNVNLDNNVRTVNIGNIHSEQQYNEKVQKIVEQKCNTEFNSLRPPWEILVITHHSSKVVKLSHYSIVIAVHHAIGDGISLVQILLNALLDEPLPQSLQIKVQNFPKISLANILSFPTKLVEQFIQRDSNILHGAKLNGKKFVAISQPIDLEKIKLVKNATGTTVNDVLTSCIAAGFADFFHNFDKRPKYITAALPIMIRKMQDMTGVANWFHVGVLHLPVNVCSPIDRLNTISRICTAYKQSCNPVMNGWLIKVMMNVMPSIISGILLLKLPNTLVVSNVIGPSLRISLWKNELSSLWFIPPHRGDVGVSVSILSYAGKVYMTISTDSALINCRANVKSIVEKIVQEFYAILDFVKQ